MRRGSLYRFVSRLAATLMLIWTGVCVTNPALCALDQEGLPQFAAVAAPDPDAAPLPSPSEEDVHVDDCFCCCRHVELGFVFAVPEAVVLSEYTSRLTGRPHAVHVTVFRPPQLSS